MRAQITFTVPGGKRLIAKAVVGLPVVVRARETGKIFLKGGSTVSAVAEELVGVPMRISGRISPRGLLTAKDPGPAPHNMLIEGSKWTKVELDEVRDAVATLRDGDVAISGANIIDTRGGAALMGGAVMGGNAGHMLTALMEEGIPIVIAAGLEKLIPGTVEQAVRAAGRRRVDLTMGMAVGLMPLVGRLVTEVEAVKLLAPVECEVIGRGGVEGAEGGVTLALSGEPEEVKRIFNLALELRNEVFSGDPVSRQECEGASKRCQLHLACVYRAPKLLTRNGGAVA